MTMMPPLASTTPGPQRASAPSNGAVCWNGCVGVLSRARRVVSLRTRMPFRYGIATATQVRHLFVSGEFEMDGKRQVGVAADHLPPKWFTKDPGTTYEDDVKELRAAIDAAC